MTCIGIKGWSSESWNWASAATPISRGEINDKLLIKGSDICAISSLKDVSGSRVVTDIKSLTVGYALSCEDIFIKVEFSSKSFGISSWRAAIIWRSFEVISMPQCNVDIAVTMR